MTLQAFIDEYEGKVSGIGDTTANIGQCVGLIELWLDDNGLPHIWGNADGLMANADKNVYTITHYAAGSYPQPGDIFCFDGYYGNGAGHTGVVVTATSSEVTLFEQNDPDGSAPHEKTYTYDHAMGWISNAKLQEAASMSAWNDIVDAQTIEMAYNGILLRGAQPNEINPRIASKQTVGSLLTELVNSQEHKNIQYQRQLGQETESATTLAVGVYKVI